MTPPKPLTEWQRRTTPETLPRHIRRNIAEGPNGCWLWTRSLSDDGYGWASLQNQTWQAHRLVYVLVVGPIAPDQHLDHVRARGCRHRHCVNPAHLEPVSPAENIRRGEPANRTHCPAGHEYSPANTHINTAGARVCRTCSNARRRARRAAA